MTEETETTETETTETETPEVETDDLADETDDSLLEPDTDDIDAA